MLDKIQTKVANAHVVRWVPGATVVRDYERSHFEFNETEISGYARLYFYKQPDAQANATLVIIHR
jgi:hypothetical protein